MAWLPGIEGIELRDGGSMKRRDVLRAVSAAAVLPFLPRSVEEAAAFGEALNRRVTQAPAFRTLNQAQQQLVSQLVDLILPATDTPGALDVRVPEFIDLLLTEWYGDEDKARFLAGLDAVDARVRAAGAADISALSPAARAELVSELDRLRKGDSAESRMFAELKSLTVYGYFTSERVAKEVLRVQMIFAEYDGCAPIG